MGYSAAPDVSNTTPFMVESAFLTDEEGRPLCVPIIKATFAIIEQQQLKLAEQQQPVNLMGSYWGEPDTSSYRLEPECAFIKPATDVVLIGHAYPPEPGATETLVGLRVGPLNKTVRVVGDRFWVSNALGMVTMTAAEPFERIPLIYERAFGGWDRSDPKQHVFEPKNPVGSGFRVRWNSTEGAVRLPNLEDPQHPIRSFTDRPAPTGFGFLSPHWQPRAAFAGTYDGQWQTERMPLLPRDFDRRYFNAAAPGLIAPGYLRGDEPVTVVGASLRGRLNFNLPGIAPPPVVVTLRDRGKVDVVTHLDTIIIDTDVHTVTLIWRGHVAIKEIPRDVLAVMIGAEAAPQASD